MVKIKGPMLSLDAAGTLGNAVVFSTWKGKSYVRAHVAPTNPKSLPQIAIRAMLAFLSSQWASLTPGQQATWEESAIEANCSPFNRYLGYNVARYRNWKPPTKAYPPAESGSPGTIAYSLTAGVRHILVHTDFQDNDSVWGNLIMRHTGIPAPWTWIYAVAGRPNNVSSADDYIDGPLPIHIHNYAPRCFGHDGSWGGFAGPQGATPTE